jgi:DNA polymerase I-like protein with 3'-5' exonuclease and polymerase domains
MSKEFAFDIETNHPTVKSKNKVYTGFVHKVAGISFAWGRTGLTSPWVPGRAAYVPLIKSDDSAYWGAHQDSVVEAIREILETDTYKVAHNGKFDVRQLAALSNIYVKGLKFDTMHAHAILDEKRLVSSHALKSDFGVDGKTIVKLGVADAYLDTQASLFKDDLHQALQFYDPQLKRYSKVPVNVLYPYACADADLTLSLKYVFQPMLEAEGMTWMYDNLIMPLQHALTLLELHGVPLDIARAQQILQETADTLHRTEEEIQTLCGTRFKVSSNQQLGALLFETLCLPGEKNEQGAWVTDSDALKKIDHPVAKPLLEYRRAQQIHGLYAEPALQKMEEITNGGMIGWVHPTYWMDSATGRLKCTDPNLTTLPRPENGGIIVKSMWCAADDYRMIFKDFSQIELRVIAHISGEPVWIDGFRAGHDMHAAMAHKIYKLPCTVEEVSKLYKAERSNAKAVNFGIAFGESEFSLAERLGITNEAAHKLIHEDYFGAAPVLRQWIEDTHTFARNNGYVNNIFGRRRHLPEAMVPIPDAVPGPKWDNRPPCYKKHLYPKSIGITAEDLFQMSKYQIEDLVKSKTQDSFAQCRGCPYIYPCIVNKEVSYMNSQVNRALRQSVNSPVQGSAVDMASLALIRISQELQRYRLQAAPILHIHDELVVLAHVSCVDQACAIMDESMTTYLMNLTNFRVPLTVDTEIVQRWSDKHKEKGHG